MDENQEKHLHLANPDANQVYNRYARAFWVSSGHCNSCDTKNIKCLAFDGSEDEYGAVFICKDCMLKMLKEIEGE
jgi:hypothetical protein